MTYDADWLRGVYEAHRFIIAPEADSACLKTIHEFGQDGVFEVFTVGLDDGFPFCALDYFLYDFPRPGPLAHVESSGKICIASSQAINVDYADPAAVAIAGLYKAVDIVRRGLMDPDWNTAELINEIQPMWERLSDTKRKLIVFAEPDKIPKRLHSLGVKEKGKRWLDKARVVHDGCPSISKDSHVLELFKERPEQGKGLLIPLEVLMPAPVHRDQLVSWLSDLFALQSDALQKTIHDLLRRNRTKELTLVFYGFAQDGPVWFGLQCKTAEKTAFSLSGSEITSWELDPLIMETPVSRDFLLPRGGACKDLQKVRVCIIGCGSVGGYVADQLASSGVCNLHLVDGDSFQTENIHRHILSAWCVGFNKAEALAILLGKKYPFLECTYYKAGYIIPCETIDLADFDLVVLATGNMTLERRITEGVYNLVKPPMLVSAWVEAYGLGGHATLTIPGREGCLGCVYRDPVSGEFTLNPKLSFIEPGQVVVTRHAGCGFEYISYSNIDAVQTAALASRLSIRGLLGHYEHGVSMSWLGPMDLAEEHGVRVSERYLSGGEGFTEVPLYTRGCDVCQ